MRDMDRAVDRVLQASRRRIDSRLRRYAVDGITSTSLLTAALTKMGAKVSYFIPDRIRDGYGFSERGVDVARKRRIRLVITADCGITATNEVALARASGIDVIVTDHHEPLGELPAAVAVLNPKRKDCPYAFKELAGVGWASSCGRGAGAVRTFYPDFVFHHLDLVALGTIADVVPLVGRTGCSPDRPRAPLPFRQPGSPRSR